jgi:hypothetical protein
MDDELIEAAPAPKKPYVRPQLHELTGSESAGKFGRYSFEINYAYGPS